MFSLIVLQHIPVPLTLGYLAEFLRVLNTGGVAVLQIPTARIDRDVQTEALRRLPRWHPRWITNKLRMLVLEDPATRFYHLRRLGLSEQMIYRRFGIHPPIAVNVISEADLQDQVERHGGTIFSAVQDAGRAGPGTLSKMLVVLKRTRLVGMT